MSTHDDTTRVERPDPTRVLPQTEEQFAPIKPPRQPMDPRDRAALIGILGALLVIGAAIAGLTLIAKTGNTDKAEQKTDQVEACTKIEDPTAALSCVIQIDG